MSDLRTYFDARALPWPPPPSIRFVRCYRWRRSDLIFPAMIAAVQSPAGDIIGAEATALTLDCRRKAFADSRDKIGIMAAGAARFARHGETLGLAEGAETAIAAMAMTGVPTWASLGAGRMHRVCLPQTVLTLIIFADNDVPGREAAERTAAQHKHLNIEIRYAPGGVNDWNDALIAERKAA